MYLAYIVNVGVHVRDPQRTALNNITAQSYPPIAVIRRNICKRNLTKRS